MAVHENQRNFIMNDDDRKNWAEAAAAGRKRFSMTEPCRRGHLGERYTFGNGACVDCQREYYARKRGVTSVTVRLSNPEHADLVRQYAESLNAFDLQQRSEKP